MKNEYFCVNAQKYDRSKNFKIIRPASLDHPKDNSVMFILKSRADQWEAFRGIKNCLIFWPCDLCEPDWMDSSNILLKVNDPHLEYCKFFKENHLSNLPKKENVLFENGYCISSQAKVGKNVVIMPFSYIGGDVTIGDNVYIGTGTKIMGIVSIGDNVIIRENTVIGADGLSTDRDSKKEAVTMPQYGGVIIEDNVEIGSNTVIARGAIDDTRIKRGSKIDNSVFISHNVQLGNNTFIVGESILFGSSSTGDNVLISGNSTIRNGVSIGENTIIGMGSVVTKNVSPNSIVAGNPAKERK